MSRITIDGVEYDLEALTEEAKSQLVGLQAVNRRITSLQEELAIHQTARNAYAAALKALLAGNGQGAANAGDRISWPSLN